MLMSAIKGISDPEKIFAIFTNNDTVALVNGDVCIHDPTGTPGVTVKGSTTVDSVLFAGVCSGPDVAVGATGTFQCYGYHSSVKGVVNSAFGSGAVVKISGTAKSATDGATADGPMAAIGVCLVALSGGRAGIWLRGM